MRKALALTLGLLLCCLPVLALAAEGGAGNLILTGKVEAKDTLTVYAPFGGTVEDFTLREGDRVAANTPLLSLDTTKIYAPTDGTVRGIFAGVGDSASVVQNRYGALCYIEPDEQFTVQTSTAQAYDSAENRFVHIGETVYLRSTSNNAREGIGRIIAVSGESYTVEVQSGTLEMRDSVNIFRDAEYATDSRIGRGTVTRVDPVAVSGDGAVLSIAVSDGAHVSRGDLLFEVVSGSFDNYKVENATVRAPQESIVASVSVTPGQTVNQNQAVVSLYSLDTLQLVSAVSEIDAQHVTIGSKVRIVFDSISGTEYEGTITSVSGVGTVSDNYTEYAVYIDFVPDDMVRLGMSGTAYPVE